jgi:type II secretory pathway pseudopilin PulG
MRTIKLILGIGCLLAAPFPAILGVLALLDLGRLEPFRAFSIASFSAILATGLIYAGGLLIARRNLPISRNTRVRLLLYFSCIGILVVVALPNFIKSRSTSCCNACINNLRQIDAAANEFALEKGKRTGDAINYPNDLTPYIKLTKDGKIPPCPEAGLYSSKRVGDTPTCSLSNSVNSPHVLP